MYMTGKFETYLDDFAGKKPAPGGGSAAAAAGALGLAALSMVGNFTVGRKKYADVEGEIQSVLDSTERIRKRLQELVDEDVEGYSAVSAAYGMPKETDAEKAARSAGIQDALRIAMAAPLATCRCLDEAVALVDPLIDKGNRNLASDVAVGAELIAGAFESAWFNVEVNLGGIKDDEFVAATRAELIESREKILTMKERISTKTRETIG